MPQLEVELILMRQLASCLAMPIVLVDPQGDILFFNEPAEELVGQRFDELGRMPFDEWTHLVDVNDEDGKPVAPEELPQLLQEIRKALPSLRIEVPKKWQLGDTWQDAWLFFLALVSLLSSEWVLRKKWGLV